MGAAIIILILLFVPAESGSYARPVSSTAGECGGHRLASVYRSVDLSADFEGKI